VVKPVPQIPHLHKQLNVLQEHINNQIQQCALLLAQMDISLFIAQVFVNHVLKDVLHVNSKQITAQLAKMVIYGTRIIIVLQLAQLDNGLIQRMLFHKFVQVAQVPVLHALDQTLVKLVHLGTLYQEVPAHNKLQHHHQPHQQLEIVLELYNNLDSV